MALRWMKAANGSSWARPPARSGPVTTAASAGRSSVLTCRRSTRCGSGKWPRNAGGAASAEKFGDLEFQAGRVETEHARFECARRNKAIGRTHVVRDRTHVGVDHQVMLDTRELEVADELRACVGM